MVQTVRFLSEECFPRDYTHPANLSRASEHLENLLEEAGWKVTRQEYDVPAEGAETVYHCWNLCALREENEGKNSEKRETRPRILVGAHYDACENTPGADDNASGMAVLVELAFLLKDLPLKNCEVELVAFCTEEPPHFATRFMGSAVHARELRKKNVPVCAMLCLDVVGYYSERPGSQDYPLDSMAYLYGTRGDFLGIVGRFSDFEAMTLAEKQISVPDLRVCKLAVPEGMKYVIDFSDHRNYWRMQVPTLFFTNTAFYRTPHYHEPTDTWDRLDFRRMARLAEGLARAV